MLGAVVAYGLALRFDRGGRGHVVTADLTWVKNCSLVDENTARVTLRYRGTAEGGAVSVGATIRLVDAKSGATAGTATVRRTVSGAFDERLPITFAYDEDTVHGDVKCWLSMARTGWHWPGH